VEEKTERREGLHLMIQGGNPNKILEVEEQGTI
jgi:hypothetical protein